jgi:putative ATPase
VRGQFGRRTILFVDEVHRFNKAQQDALLPWVENGTVILVGATTENPYFEVNAALVSRSRIFRLEPLSEPELRRVAQQALADTERGFGDRTVTLSEEALDHLVDVSNGDARALLNALELAVETTPPDAEGHIVVSLTVAEESIQRRAVFYDKEGDAHFDAISAFIKSCRGSDPDAALYWLARMVHAGEDPRFLLRRLVILASEDVGMADPECLPRVLACAQSYDRIGMPEGRYPLAQATLLVATAAKSNSTMGFFAALAAVESQRTTDVPDPLKDPSRDKESLGHGQGYLYPHAYREHWVAQQYLPAGLVGQVFYQPSDQGHEATIKAQVVRRREAQLAALEDETPEPKGLSTGATRGSLGEVNPASLDRWARRANAGAGARMGALRDGVFARAEVQRHHLILELRARTGLLSWEALRTAPEGGVHTWITEADPEGARLFETLHGQVAGLDPLLRPLLIRGPLQPGLEDDRGRMVPEALRQALPGARYDRILGHNVFGGVLPENLEDLAQGLADALTEHGRIVLAEPVPRRAQRLSLLVPPDGIDGDLWQRWHAAEAHIYEDESEPQTRWDATDLGTAFETAGLDVRLALESTARPQRVTAALMHRWWHGDGERPGYAQRLSLPEDDLRRIERFARGRWIDQELPWHTTFAWLVAKMPGALLP